MSIVKTKKTLYCIMLIIKNYLLGKMSKKEEREEMIRKLIRTKSLHTPRKNAS